MTNKKMYLVKREVMAYSVKDAINRPGRIYSVEECKDPIPDEKKKGQVGFTNKKDASYKSKKR